MRNVKYLIEVGEPQSLRTVEPWRAAAAEFIATLLFVFIGCGAVIASDIYDLGFAPARLLVIAVGHGLAITILAAAVGGISGGHINPAVTVAMVAAKKTTVLSGALYIVSQLLGAVAGALLLHAATPTAWQGSLGAHALGPGVTSVQGLLMEIVLSFILVFVIFGVAVDPKGPAPIASIPIGFAVLVDLLVGIPVSGASMNPARSFGPALVSGQWGSQWIYWVGPLVGGLLAAVAYRFVFAEDSEIVVNGDYEEALGEA